MIEMPKIEKKKDEKDEEIKPKCVWDENVDRPIRELFIIPSASDISDLTQVELPEFLKMYDKLVKGLTNIVDVSTEAIEAVHLWNWCRICPVHLKRLKEVGVKIKLNL